MIYTRVVSTGSYLPKTILTNAELAKKVDTSDEWIRTRTGIESRHIASAGETTASMGTWAALQALETAQLLPEDIDLIVVATCTPDKFFPSTACLIQAALGVPPCPAFDLQAACSGFIYGLTVVDKLIRSGMAKRALFIGSETMSRGLDWTDRKTCILFGDGAAALILEASNMPGILDTQVSADGRQKDILYWNHEKDATIVMEGSSVFKLAVNTLDAIAEKTLVANQLTVQDVDWLVPHQANLRIIQATAEKLGLPMEKVVLTLQKQGNTSAASIPLAFDAAIREGKIQRGHHVLLEAFGAGLTWGTALIRY